MNGDGKPLTTKSLVVAAAAVVSIMGGFTWVHANVVVPQILLDVNTLIREEIKDHNSGPSHPGAISREELRLLVLERINDLATREQIEAVNARLDRMDARLLQLEKR